MKFSHAAAVATFTVAVAASSSDFAVEKRAVAAAVPGGDTTILNYALTLEHLEAFFYKQALAKFNEAAFKKAGYPAYVRQRVVELANEEAIHVAFLTGALGKAATKACKYSFPYKTVTEFLALSRVLEGVGVSAYLGAAADISTPAYLTAAGSILTVEARHQAVVSEFQGEAGFPSPFDTPLDFSQVYSLAAPFFVPGSCPSSNPTLPVVQFPQLTFTGNATPGHKFYLQYKSTSSYTNYAHFLNGLNDIAVKVGSDGSVVFPKGLHGTVYIVVADCETLSDKKTLAGPAIIELSDADI